LPSRSYDGKRRATLSAVIPGCECNERARNPSGRLIVEERIPGSALRAAPGMTMEEASRRALQIIRKRAIRQGLGQMQPRDGLSAVEGACSSSRAVSRSHQPL
jgi:hypothetical protein